MEPNANYAIVGLFVIILTVAIILGIIWLSVGFGAKPYIVYRVYMNESVNGLNVDSPVKYNGVDVGKVKALMLNPANPQQVELLLNIEEGTPITKSTVAILTSQGITGVAFIDLQTRGNDRTLLLPTPRQPYPVIRSAPSLYFRLDQALSELTTNFNHLTSSISAAFDEENRGHLKQTLKNLDNFTSHLSNDAPDLDALIHNIFQSSKGFSGFLEGGKETFRNINEQTMPKVHEILDNLDTVSSNFADASGNISDISREIKENPAVLLRGKAPRCLGPGEKPCNCN